VHRKLLFRLGLLSVGLALLFGGAAFLQQQQRLETTVSRQIVERVQRFEVLVQLREGGIPDENSLGREFLRFLERAPSHRSGRIETARLYAPDGRLLVSHPIAERRLETRLDAARDSRVDSGRVRHDTLRLEGGTYVLLGTPVRTVAGDELAHVEAAFRLSDATLAEIRGGALRAGLWVALFLWVAVAATYPITMQVTRRLIVLSGNLLQANIDTAQVLGSAIAKRDGDTAEHNSRVTLISVGIAEAYGLHDDSIRNLIKGAFVHDVGKIAVSDSILLKPGRLTYEEFEVMKTHVQEGVEIVERSDWLSEGVSVVRDHHEKFDGTGYLQGLKGDAIPVEARIFAIADVFDALTSRRPYKEPLSFEETMRVLEQGRGSHFDPELLDAFTPIAPTLFRELIQRPAQSPHVPLREMVGHYFSQLTGDLKI
jgi:HD-GYP domain-containing protein (c-di-GMP phosphodiesterase class II)